MHLQEAYRFQGWSIDLFENNKAVQIRWCASFMAFLQHFASESYSRRLIKSLKYGSYGSRRGDLGGCHTYGLA